MEAPVDDVAQLRDVLRRIRARAANPARDADDAQALADAFHALREELATPEILGDLTDLAERPWSELNDLQRWVRNQQFSVDEARKAPALTDMEAVFNQLTQTSQHSGPPLRVAPGANILALDRHSRRYLIPRISREVAYKLTQAHTHHDVEQIVTQKGSVSFHWSTEQAGLVPEPDELARKLPLPEGGHYLMLYRASVEVAGKTAYRKAATKLVETHRFADVLFWDTGGDEPTLWTTRGGFGYGSDGDKPWNDHLIGAQQEIAKAMERGRQT